ncbi:MAG TPA: PDZ domain-containing protein [Kofleriaceae bacterium]|nr:PDZ domain-containing protein [Kofleriaceae bacterium]
MKGAPAGAGGTTKVLAAVTDASGRFALSGVPVGALAIASSTDGDDGYSESKATFTISDPGELGDIAMVRARAFGDDAIGSTGFHLGHDCSSDPTPAHRVDRVTPDSSAARAGVVEGDEIVAVDGIDVTGIDVNRYAAAIAAPPGTRISLRLARGVRVTFALGEP